MREVTTDPEPELTTDERLLIAAVYVAATTADPSPLLMSH